MTERDLSGKTPDSAPIEETPHDYWEDVRALLPEEPDPLAIEALRDIAEILVNEGVLADIGGGRWHNSTVDMEESEEALNKARIRRRIGEHSYYTPYGYASRTFAGLQEKILAQTEHELDPKRSMPEDERKAMALLDAGLQLNRMLPKNPQK